MTETSRSLGATLRSLVRGPTWFFVAGIAAFAWAFEELSDTFTEAGRSHGRFAELDRGVLSWLAAHRKPSLTGIALDLTALGSSTVLALVTVLGTVVLVSSGRSRDALHLAILSLGAAVLTAVFKRFLARPRPDFVPALVLVTDKSYPSGHTLGATCVYLAIAWMASTRGLGRRAAVTAAALLAVAIATSRMYLGVHYPTDVAGGVAVALGWLLTAALVRQYGTPLA